MKLEYFVFFILPMFLGISALIAAVLFNIYRIYKKITAERKFIKFLKADKEFQSKSMLRPNIRSLLHYLGLFSKMLDKSNMSVEEGDLVFEGIRQKYPACLNYMQKLWDKGKNNKINTISCMEEEL